MRRTRFVRGVRRFGLEYYGNEIQEAFIGHTVEGRFYLLEKKFIFSELGEEIICVHPVQPALNP
jgi:hypothetical protein